MVWCGWLQRRYLVSLLSFLGLCLSFGLRSALSVTFTDVVKTNDTGEVACNDTRQETNCTKDGEFTLYWSTDEVGWVFTAYGIGYIITQLPGGVLAAALPAHRVFCFSTLLSFALFATIPSLMKVDWRLVVVIRLLQGLSEGVQIPAQQGIWKEWAPEHEKNKLSLVALSGAYCGPAIAMLLTGFVNSHFGWEWIFYIYSIAGGVWGLIWLLVVFKSPYKALERLGEKERAIFEEERRKKHADLFDVSVRSATGHEAVRGIPFKAILTSLPVWAVFVAGTTRSWVLLLVTNYFSQYLENVYHLDIIEIGYLSSLPFFVTTVTVCLGAVIADFCLKRKVASRTAARKMFNCIGFGVEASILCLVGFMTLYFKSKILAVVLLGLSCGASGFAASGYQANPLDLARDYASVLMGISKLGGIGGMIMPKVVGALTRKGDVYGWARVFWVTAGLEMAGVIFYAIFASGKQQKWSNYRDAREMEDEDEDEDEDTLRASAGGRSISYRSIAVRGRTYGSPDITGEARDLRHTINESYVDDEERPLLMYASERESHVFTDSMTVY